MTDKYLQRGVSANKNEVHEAVRQLDHGLYPQAFCKIYPDYLVADPAYCNVMSADGSGTKSILAYLYWRETGDLTVWNGIAQDAIVMNLDDLICIGATEQFLLTSIINRNKNFITGDALGAIINGTKQFIDRMAEEGINIKLMGGETADLGDIVKTVTVDAAMTARLRRSDLILTQNIKPNDVIVGLASYGQATYESEYNSGISSNGLTSARHDLLSHHYAAAYPETFDATIPSSLIYIGSKRLSDSLEGTPLTVGKALLSPTRTFAPVIKKALQLLPGKIKGIINCTGGAHTKVLHYINNLRIVKDNLLDTPPLFRLIQSESQTSWREMYQVLNCGTRLEIYLDLSDAEAMIAIAKSYGIDALVIGHVEHFEGKEVIIKGEYGEYQYKA